MSQESYRRFEPSPSANVLSFTDGPYVAHVVCPSALGCWSYVVFYGGRAIDGAYSWDLDAFQACELALAVIDAHRKGVIR